MAPAVALSRAIVCAVVTITSIEGVAHADRVTRRPVAVIELVSAPEAQDLARRLGEELTRHPELEPLIDPIISLLTGPLLDNEDATLLGDAEANYVAAEEALSRFDLSVVQAETEHGLDNLDKVSPAAATPVLAKLAIVKGQQKLGQNDPKDPAARWFTLAHRLAPKLRLDPARFLPEVVAAFDQATPLAQAPGALEVDGSRGRVYIDGVDVGVPNATFEVPPGFHIVHITGPEREPRGMLVEVPIARPGAPSTVVKIADAPASEGLLIQRARVALARATDPTVRASTMRNLAKLIKVGDDRHPISDAILILRMNGKLVTQAWRDHAPGFDAPIFNKPVEATKVRPIDMLAWLAPPRSLQEIDKGRVLPPPPPAWYEKRWVQASAVSTLIVVVLAGYLYSQRGGGMIPVNTMVMNVP